MKDSVCISKIATPRFYLPAVEKNRLGLLLHHGLEMVDSVNVKYGLGFVMVAMCPCNMGIVEPFKHVLRVYNCPPSNFGV